jgi:hypothetical protein
MGSGIDFPETDDLRLPDDLIPTAAVSTPTIEKLRARKQRRFTLGPIPLEWWLACKRADPNALYLALGVLMVTGSNVHCPGGRWATISETFGQQIELSRDQRRRALAGLEAAGLMDVERKPHHAPRARLRPWRE